MYKIILKRSSRILLLLLFIASTLFLYGCIKDDTAKLEKIADELFSDIESENITSDLNFPLIIDEVYITYVSSDLNVINEKGIVQRQSEDVEIEVTATFNYKNTKYQRSYKFTVLGIKTYSEYYIGIEGLSGSELKQFLHDLIDDHTEYSYDFAKTALRETDADPDNPNNIILFYTGRSQPKSTFGGGSGDWNREHVWAKSHGNFGESKPAGTDLHHLRPTDVRVNSTRGNKDFDEGGSKVNSIYGVGSSFNYSDSDSFEPRDEVKGDVARILFYMAVRYEGDKNGEPDLELNDNVNNGSRPYMGRLSILLKWHEEDPVDDFERNRNNVIYSYQNNRNPFIDYPELAFLIWGK